MTANYIKCEHCGAFRNTDGAYTSTANRVRDTRDWQTEHVTGWCVGRVSVPRDPQERQALGIKVKNELAVLLEKELAAQRALNDLMEEVLLAAKRVQSFNEQTKLPVDPEYLTEEQQIAHGRDWYSRNFSANALAWSELPHPTKQAYIKRALEERTPKQVDFGMKPDERAPVYGGQDEDGM